MSACDCFTPSFKWPWHLSWIRTSQFKKKAEINHGKEIYCRGILAIFFQETDNMLSCICIFCIIYCKMKQPDAVECLSSLVSKLQNCYLIPVTHTMTFCDSPFLSMASIIIMVLNHRGTKSVFLLSQFSFIGHNSLLSANFNHKSLLSMNNQSPFIFVNKTPAKCILRVWGGGVEWKK